MLSCSVRLDWRIADMRDFFEIVAPVVVYVGTVVVTIVLFSLLAGFFVLGNGGFTSEPGKSIRRGFRSPLRS